MVDTMHFARNSSAKDDDEAEQDRLYEAEDIREELTKETNWKSSRI